MKSSFFERVTRHPQTSAWGVVALLIGIWAAINGEWEHGLGYLALAYQQLNSFDRDRVTERPPDQCPPPPPPVAPLALLAGVLALSGCAAPRYLERTTVVRDTVVISAPARLDTITRLVKSVDTVRIDTGRVRVFVRRAYDTLQVAARCEPDTIHLPGALRTERVEVAQPCPDPPNPWPGRLLAFCFGLCAGALGYAWAQSRRA